MKPLRTIQNDYIQRITGNEHAPIFVINHAIYYVYNMEESYIASGVTNEHHTLKALVGKEDRYDEYDPLKWYNLYINYSTNEYSLEQTEPPKE